MTAALWIRNKKKMKEVSTFAFPLPSSFILMLRQCLSRRKLSPTPTPIVPCLVLPVSKFSDDRHTSKRLAKEAGTMNTGAGIPYPPRQVGTAHPPLSSSSSSSFSSKYELEKPVKKVFGAVTRKECKRVRGTAAVTTQAQALAGVSLQVR